MLQREWKTNIKSEHENQNQQIPISTEAHFVKYLSSFFIENVHKTPHDYFLNYFMLY